MEQLSHAGPKAAAELEQDTRNDVYTLAILGGLLGTGAVASQVMGNDEEERYKDAVEKGQILN